MNIIIATSNAEFAKQLKEGFKDEKVNVVEIVTCLEDFFDVLGKNPNVDGILLKTDLAKKGQDYRLEMLSDSILSIRKTPEFEKIVFTILTDYSEGHPLLAEFFGMGIYNFFSRGNAFNIHNLVKSFESPMSFSIAVKYRDPNPEILWRRINTSPQTFHVKFENGTIQEAPALTSNTVKDKEEHKKEKRNKTPEDKVKEEIIEVKEDVKVLDVDGENEVIEEKIKEKKQIKLPQFTIPSLPTLKVQKIEDVQLDEEWFINQKEEQEIQIPSPAMGYVLISVAAVKEHLGATNTAINIAKFLKQAGYDVALIEANKSLDFDRIHSLIEGDILSIDEMEFTYQGIDHFKYREGFDIGSIYQRYQYIVLDMGVVEDSPYKDDFSRSHIKIVNASSNEWKFYWVEEFLLRHAFDDIIFVLPCADQNGTEDFADKLKGYEVYALEKNSSPYDVLNESKEIYEQILLDHNAFVGKRSKTSKHTLKTIVLTAVVMIIIFISILYYLNDGF